MVRLDRPPLPEGRKLTSQAASQAPPVWFGASSIDPLNDEAASLAMRFIARWSLIELMMTQAVTLMVETDFRTVAAMLDKARGSRDAAIEAAIRVNRPDEIRPYKRAWRYLKSFKERRELFSHGIIGHWPKDPSSLVVMRQRSISGAFASLLEHGVLGTAKAVGEVSESVNSEAIDSRNPIVFTLGDLREHLRCMDAAHRVARAIENLIAGRPSEASQARAQLLAD